MRMAIEPDKYVPELHRVLLSTLDELVNQIEFDESLSFSVMIANYYGYSNARTGKYTRTRWFVFVSNRALLPSHGALDNAFYRSSPLFVHYLQAISELGHHLDWYPSAITRWQNFAKGHSLQ
uniref:hypothetical protein n=1 Tax=Vibrio parahaemolyticus TaxID=670 RepID=UPI001594F0AB|nr:hypothetical protein [Vibrio parahaemolyticus]